MSSPDPQHPTRRQFAKAAALTAVSARRILGANDRVRLGFIGIGNRGGSLLSATREFADQQITAVCDLRDDYLDRAVETAGSNPDRFKDYRKLLERSDIDAVVIATPDHWHALQMIDACKAGKDVYVEKPLSLTIVEGRRMVEAAERTKRVVQVGIHRRSSPYCREAAEIARSGAIGHITVARCAVVQNQWPLGIGNPPETSPPADVDWDLFLGPTPAVPYNENRNLYRFRWFYNYAGGQLSDNGVHFLDLIQWGLGRDSALSVTAIGGKYAVEDNREVPDTLEVLWEMPGRTLVIFSQFDCNAAPISNTRPLLAQFRGTKGTVNVFSDGYEVVPESNASLPSPAGTPLDRGLFNEYRDSMRPAIEGKEVKGSADTRFHIRNFLDCIKSREKPNCDIESAHRSTTLANIGNIAHKTHRHLDWDRDAEQFTNSDEANRFLHYEYRAPWKLG
jgi:predicted dehydrogenase